MNARRPRRRWYHLRKSDLIGLLGAALLVPQIVAWYLYGRAAEPTLAGVGLTLVLAANGGSRAVDALEAYFQRRSGSAE